MVDSSLHFRLSAAASIGLLALLQPASAGAQVIEISDDGDAVTYSRPTQFVSGRSDPVESKLPARVAADVFETAARTHNVDVKLLRAVAWTESRGNNRAVSPKGALGVMQLMPATARELGVDPRDETANIFGGAQYLARQIASFQSVPLALAAYNAGPGAVRRWRGVPPFAETQAYVSSIMRRWGGQPAIPAARTALRNHDASLPIPTMLIEVPTP